MSSKSWLRQLFQMRFPGARPTPPLSRLAIESLEDRTVPTAVWTGANVPLPTAAAGSTLWSDPQNWQGLHVPDPGEDVVFPAITGARKPPSGTLNNIFVFPDPTTTPGYPNEANVTIDGNYTIGKLTILDDNYHFDAPLNVAQTLTITGSIETNIPQAIGSRTGVSLIGTKAGAQRLTLALTQETQQLNAVGPGLLYITSPIIDSPTATLPNGAGFEKVNTGRIALAGNNTFTGGITVSGGTLIAASSNALGATARGTVVNNGATLAVVGPASLAESVVVTGDGVDTDGDGNADGAIQQYTNPYTTFTMDATGGLGRPGLGQPAVNGTITLNSSASIGASGGLGINGQITGPGNLTKLGAGTVTLFNNNTYGGQTLVRRGTLQIAADGALSTNGGSTETPNTATSTTVFNGAMLEVLGALTVGETLFLNGDGIPDNVGRGQGALHQLTVNTSTFTGPITLQTASSIGAVLTPLGSPTTSQLNLTGALLGGGALSKVDAGNVRITRANPNYTGSTTVRNGTLQLANAQAVGPATASGGGSITVASTSGTAAAASGTLQLEGTYALAKTLSLNGGGFQSTGALTVVAPQGGGTSTITLPLGFSLVGATNITVDAGNTLDELATGVITGGPTATLDKAGTGTLVLRGNNTYTGATVLRQGRNLITSSTALGAANSGDTTVNAGATLELNGSLSVVGERLNIAGTGFGGIGALLINAGASTWSGEVNLLGAQAVRTDINVNGGGSLTFSNVISGGTEIHKAGAGTLIFTGAAANTYTPGTFVDLGELQLGKTAGVNAVGGSVTVGTAVGSGNNSARLVLLADNQIPESAGGVDVTVTVNETGLLNLNGRSETLGGPNGANALVLFGGEVATGAGLLTLNTNVATTGSAETSSVTGNVSLAGGTRTFNVANGSAATDLLVNGVVSNGAGLVKAGAGLMQVAGSYSYTGSTQVTAGALQLGATNVLPDVSAVTVSGGATFDANGFSDTVGSLAGAGTVTLGTGSVTVGGDNTSTTFSGVITGGVGGVLGKIGTGVLTLTGNSPAFVGTAVVAGGTLAVNGTTNGFGVTVNGGTLAGTGSVATVTANGGQVAPGAPGANPGILSDVGPLTLNAGSTFVVEANGTTAGNGPGNYDRVNANGPVTINGAALSFALGYTAAVGDAYVIINATGGLTGTFAGLPDGARFTQNNRVLQVNYAASGVTVSVVANAAAAAVSSSNNPAAPGQPITFTFTLTPTRAGDPTPAAGAAPGAGSVQFFDNGVAIPGTVTYTGSGTQPLTATLTVPSLPAGPHTITAQYTPPTAGALYQATSASLAQAVTAATTVAVAPQSGPTVFGDNAAFLVSVAQQPGLPVPTGTVVFQNAATGQELGRADLDGTGRVLFNTTALPAGTTTVRAVYQGNSFYRSATATATQVVDRQNRIVTGTDAGPVATVTVRDSRTGAVLANIRPFDQYTQGVKVATGDVTGDGVADVIVSAGAGAPGGHVKVYDGVTFAERQSFFSFPGFVGGVNVAAGDVDGDGFADVLVGAGAGAGTNGAVKVFSGRDGSVLSSFLSFPGYNGGVTVGAGDVDGDGRAEVIVGSFSSAGHVKVFRPDGAQVSSYFAYGAGYQGGIWVAGGDLDGDGRAEIITGATNAAHVKALALDGAERASFFAYTGPNGGAAPFGARVATADRTGDRLADILVGAGAGEPRVNVYSGLNPGQLIDTFLAGAPGTGVFVGGSNR